MTDKWHGGKGSKPRPLDKKKFDNNFDCIFRKPICPLCGGKNISCEQYGDEDVDICDDCEMIIDINTGE